MTKLPQVWDQAKGSKAGVKYPKKGKSKLQITKNTAQIQDLSQLSPIKQQKSSKLDKLILKTFSENNVKTYSES
ncbi:hypothetical protein [Algoriphagus aquimarinus]|uniref:hypothetical protein n=1 Tax=Algoriphagus aquimarinus TaxID=237018 RepID=UPI0030DA93A4|tara:strand:- start:130543 stop:130764 length:222 start_codon:yes stop_codon:yes gene_type:complete